MLGTNMLDRVGNMSMRQEREFG